MCFYIIFLMDLGGSSSHKHSHLEEFPAWHFFHNSVSKPPYSEGYSGNFFFFFFSANKLFLKNSSFLRAAKCQTQSYGWCRLRVETHAPFIHPSCGSFAVQTPSAARVPVTAELSMNIDHVHPDVDLNQVDGKAFLKAQWEVFLCCRVFRMNLKKHQPESASFEKLLLGERRICTFNLVILEGSFIIQSNFSAHCIYLLL